MTKHQLCCVGALVLAILSIFIVGYPILAIAVILLALGPLV